MKSDISNKLKEVVLFLFDLDGVLIKEEIFSEDEKREFIKEIENVSSRFNSLGFKFGIVTARPFDEIISVINNIPNSFIIYSSLEKVKGVSKLLEELKLEFKNVFYAGDEVLDIPLLKKCGLSAAPSSANREVKRNVDIILKGTDPRSLFLEIFSLIQSTKYN